MRKTQLPESRAGPTRVIALDVLDTGRRATGRNATESLQRRTAPALPLQKMSGAGWGSWLGPDQCETDAQTEPAR